MINFLILVFSVIVVRILIVNIFSIASISCTLFVCLIKRLFSFSELYLKDHKACSHDFPFFWYIGDLIGSIFTFIVKSVVCLAMFFFFNQNYKNHESCSYCILRLSVSGRILQRTLYEKDFYINLGIGLFITVMLMAFHDSSWLMSMEDEEMDWIMKIRRDYKPESDRKILGTQTAIPAFVFLDIDNETHKAWGKPEFTPPACLKNIIERSVNKGAKLVIVDVDLNREKPFDEETPCPGPTNPGKDEKLSEFLKRYIDECKERNYQDCTPILLVRTFNAESEEAVEKSKNIIKPLELNSSILDKVVIQGQSFPVEWASAEMIANTNDNKVRRWWLWQPACRGGKPGIIPSIELLTATMLCHSNPKEGYDYLLGDNQNNKKGVFDDNAPKSCDEDYEPSKVPPIHICGDEQELVASGGMYGIQQRIIYRMPLPLKLSVRKTMKYQIMDKRGTAILGVFSAKSFAKPSTGTVEQKSFENKIVIIGGGYLRGGDNHLTPLGEMSGGLILINAINSLLEYGEVNKLKPWWLPLVFTLVFVFLMSMAFTHFHESFDAKIWVGVVIIFILVPLSTFYLGQGVWLDFAYPLMVVEFHHLMHEIKGSQKVPKVKTSEKSKCVGNFWRIKCCSEMYCFRGILYVYKMMRNRLYLRRRSRIEPILDEKKSEKITNREE